MENLAISAKTVHKYLAGFRSADVGYFVSRCPGPIPPYPSLRWPRLLAYPALSMPFAHAAEITANLHGRIEGSIKRKVCWGASIMIK